MIRRATGFILQATAALSLIALGFGCNSTPTVPLPPPDMREVTTTSPDVDGYVTISGNASAAEPESVVLLFNEDLESGVMETAERDGSFEAMVEADVGHTLILQLKLENTLSYERYISVE